MEFRDVPDLLLLQSVRVVAHYCLPKDCGELPHVPRQLDAFLDSFSTDWTVLTAYKRLKSLRCVQYVAARAVPEIQDPFFKRWLLNRTVEIAAIRGDLATIRWLMESYLPTEQVANVMEVAAANGDSAVAVVDWLREHAVPKAERRNDVLRSAAKAGNLGVVQWLCDGFGMDASDVVKFAIGCCQWDTARWIIERFEISGLALDSYFPARHVNTTMRLPLELQQWLLTKYADELSGCHFDVPKVDWRPHDSIRPPPIVPLPQQCYTLTW
ncbi:uncharacterized protein KRP23_14559 [Phytophthora ramorum]|uniref:uncharacterized protein n=1 Tax=Phytophthora ramorum TaxID=164328 RepID=UPI0030AE31A8|nr:hypothetical protein KRP23_14559 [Phytophthora ramorum]